MTMEDVVNERAVHPAGVSFENALGLKKLVRVARKLPERFPNRSYI